MVEGPCKGCLIRFVGCHASCEKYKQFKEDLAADTELRKRHKKRYSNYDPQLRAAWFDKKKRERQ